MMSEGKRRFAVIKTRFSKGDVIYTETIRVFGDEQEAQAFLEDFLKGRDNGFRWSDWDEYDIREQQPIGRGDEDKKSWFRP